MDERSVGEWFRSYLDAFAACGRGESDPGAMFDYYGVPMMFATDEDFVVLSSEEEGAAAIQTQIDGLLAAGYDHSEVLDEETTVLNATSALHTARFSRRRRDESEIGQLTATYLITDGPAGHRISAIAIHSA